MIKRKKIIAVIMSLLMTLSLSSINFKTAYAGEYISNINEIGRSGNYATDSNGLTWLYFKYDDGTMAHDTWIGNYYVNNSGAWVN